MCINKIALKYPVPCVKIDQFSNAKLCWNFFLRNKSFWHFTAALLQDMQPTNQPLLENFFYNSFRKGHIHMSSHATDIWFLRPLLTLICRCLIWRPAAILLLFQKPEFRVARETLILSAVKQNIFVFPLLFGIFQCGFVKGVLKRESFTHVAAAATSTTKNVSLHDEQKPKGFG